MAYTDLDRAKKHLNIEDSFTDDDTYITDLIVVAEKAIDDYCNGGLADYSDETMPVTVKQAALLLTAHFYSNRTMVSFAQGAEIPYSFKFLLNPYRILTIA